MPDAKYFNVGGTSYSVNDDTARNNAQGAAEDVNYLTQFLMGTYAGRSLASVFANEIASYDNAWDWLEHRATSNNPSGILPMDYLEFQRTNGDTERYLVADYDPYYNCGDTAHGHHFLMMRSAPVSNIEEEYQTENGDYIKWNTTNTNQGTAEKKNPYLCSNLHKWETEVYWPSIPQNVRDHILATHRMLVEERYSADGALTEPSGWSWQDIGPIFSLSETEVYGQNVWSEAGYGTGADAQLAIFRRCCDRLLGGRTSWWLRSVARGSSTAACYGSSGSAGYFSAAGGWVRPRPCFLVG